jgi:Domain of unknown function (DU1801)
MQSKATTVKEYLASLPEDRRKALSAVRAAIVKHLDKGYEEGMGYGMMGWSVPHSIFPAGYHCDPRQPLPFAGLASQKGHMSLYLSCLYYKEATDLLKWFRDAWAKSGKKKLDMGKCCVRFKSVDEVPLDVIGELMRKVPVKKYVAMYQSALDDMNQAKGAKRRRSEAATKGSGKKKSTK